ncbi:MAG: type II toxin-antitoxin system VapC family toxin [Acidobacteria bacterium]|nr:type II toxin-antitoxin system VapC family toxin [Acidobacteriota bacterium]
MRYFDASAPAKRYVREKGSLKIRRLLSSDVPATSRLSAVEIVSALMRRSREGALTDKERRRALAALEADMAAMLVVELTPEIVTRAQALLTRHPLRAGDAIQLASCLYLQEELEDEPTLVAFDARLVAAARRERGRVE